MRRHLVMLRLSFRNIGKLYYFPPVVALVLFPFLASRYKSTAADATMTFLSVSRLAQLLLPVLVVWWIYFALHERLEGNGRETLWAYRSGLASLLIDLALVWIWYAFHMAVAMFVLSLWLPNAGVLYAHLLTQSLFYVGCFCLITGLSGSAGAGFLVVLAYYFATAFLASGFIQSISIFMSEELLYGFSFLRRDVFFATFGVAGALFGVLFMRKRKI